MGLAHKGENIPQSSKRRRRLIQVGKRLHAILQYRQEYTSHTNQSDLEHLTKWNYFIDPNKNCNQKVFENAQCACFYQINS